jgi:hypothetical protein
MQKFSRKVYQKVKKKVGVFIKKNNGDVIAQKPMTPFYILIS